MSSRDSLSSTSLNPTQNPICECGTEVLKLTAWTDANPGRSYYKCEAVSCDGPYKGCNYFGWADKEPPHGWQRIALLNARDRTRILEVENDRLKRELSLMAHGAGALAVDVRTHHKQSTFLAGLACIVSAMALVAALMK